mgnify:CR=1 FL=1
MYDLIIRDGSVVLEDEIVKADIGVKKGKIAPPTIDMISQEDPCLVSLPNPTIPNENMVGNIMDIKKPNPPSA